MFLKLKNYIFANTTKSNLYGNHTNKPNAVISNY